jgi:hypothetical protein
MQADAIKGSVPIYAGLLAGQVGVEVEWGSFPTASTDGKRIKMPDLPLRGQELARLVYGYTVHEAAHIRHTQFDVLQARIGPLEPGKAQLLRKLWNSMEDPRIERCMCNDFQGARLYLGSLMEALDESGSLGRFDPSAPLAQQIELWIFWRANAVVMQYDVLADRYAQQSALVRQLLPPDLYGKLDAALSKLPAAACTSDVIDIACEIYDALQDSSQPQQQPQGGAGQQSGTQATGNQPGGQQQPQGGAGQQSGTQATGDQPSGQQQPQGSASQQGGTQATGDQPSDQQQPQGGASQQGGTQATGNQPGGQPQPQGGAGQQGGTQVTGDQPGGQRQPLCSTQPQASVQQLRQLLDQSNWGRFSDRGEMVSARLPGSIKNAGQALAASGHGGSRVHMANAAICAERRDGSAVLGEVRRHTIALRARFEEALEDFVERRVTAARSGRRLLRDVGTRLARGNTKVFRRQSERREVAASIYMLVDKSTSMDKKVAAPGGFQSTRLKEAAKAALLMAVALEDLDEVEVAVAAFPHRVGTDVNGVIQLKGFDEGTRESAGRIGTLSVTGVTPLASAMLHAHLELAHVEEGRRIVLAICDGQPDSVADCKAVMDLGLDDVEYLGIGIGVDIKHLFPTSVRIDSVDELPAKALELVRKVLLTRDE